MLVLRARRWPDMKKLDKSRQMMKRTVELVIHAKSVLRNGLYENHVIGADQMMYQVYELGKISKMSDQEIKDSVAPMVERATKRCLMELKKQVVRGRVDIRVLGEDGEILNWKSQIPKNTSKKPPNSHH